jgi:two-component system NtrC family sensor kinase
MMTEQVIEAGKLASVGNWQPASRMKSTTRWRSWWRRPGWIGDMLAEEEFQQTEPGGIQTFPEDDLTQGNGAKEITHKLLSFARKTDPKVREVEINELIMRSSAFEQRAKYGNIHLTMNLARTPGGHGLPSEMQQVLLNLINNAIDGIGTGGGTSGSPAGSTTVMW